MDKLHIPTLIPFKWYSFSIIEWLFYVVMSEDILCDDVTLVLVGVVLPLDVV